MTTDVDYVDQRRAYTRKREERGLSPGLASLLLLTALAAVGQFASNIYTPSLPFVAIDLGVSADTAQASFAVFLLAFAAMQLVYGPLADRFGRRPVLFAGLGLFMIGTAACAVADSLSMLLIARATQAAGAAGALIISRAATRDSFEGVALQKAIATVTIAFALVPGLTPLLGGLTQELAGWRAAFWLTLAVGGLIAVLAFIKLPETLRGQPAQLSVSAALRGYAAVAGDRIAMTYALAAGLVFGAMSAFFAASPTLFIDHLGVGPVEYGLYPPIAVTGFIIGGIITRRLAGKVPAIRIAATGLTIMAVALSLMLAFPAAGEVHKHIFNATMVMNVTGLGVFLPTAITQVLARFPDRAGTAAAMQGFIQMSGGAMGAFAVSGLQAHLPLLAMPTVMLACVLLSASVFTLGLSTARRAPIQA